MKQIHYRRLFLYVVAPIIVIACCFFLGSRSNAESTEEAVEHILCYESVLIHKGDTLWSIAESRMEEPTHAEIQEYVREIASINQITSSRIHAGKYIVLPIYG